MNDDDWMRKAVACARRGLGGTYPNPCVGAVVVRGRVAVGAAHSAATGGPHAEVRALATAGARARGATLYVTLEPCSHIGRTGPCTRAIIDAGIRRVVLGVRDPAEHVRGRGVRALVRAGIEVVEGVGERACAEVHEHYLHHERTRRPFVTLKAATSVDGCIAASSGDSKWITGVESRRHGHRLRAQHHAIAVGAQTVVADDPRLDVRLVRGVSPLVVVFDSRLRLAGARRLHLLREGTWILHTAAAPKRARARLRALGVELIEVEQDQGRVDLRHALELLGKRCVRSILVEGGGRLLGSFVQAASWERLYLYQAPRILGAGVGAFCGARWEKVADAPSLLVEGRRRMGSDLLSIFRRDAEPRAKRRAAKHRSRA